MKLIHRGGMILMVPEFGNAVQDEAHRSDAVERSLVAINPAVRPALA